ncbi:galactokinase family protein [Lentzea sp. BCCO 10_0061]|uniref:Galactokinase family protein n=1 Tax=Lentzea sokolovensis TaxID=3095429 RepID=A0ABU4UXB7_9PSEU|nr:galactokinase family protein [Lentzea sp. BCCO 10_0061]MDX8143386.1 galactokinase family protein [Lentzea sp. BCCO 10_0061]
MTNNSTEPDTARSAPARICLAGEDLDWLGGSSLQAAIDLRIRCALTLAPRPSGFEVRASGTLTGRASSADVWTPADEAWADLARLAVTFHHDRDDDRWPSRLDIVSAIPPGAGLASSAALCVATLAISADWAVPGEPIDAGLVVERELAGRDVGPMDYVPCTAGGVVRVFCHEGRIESVGQLEWPSDLAIVVVDTRRTRDTSEVIRWKRARSQAGDPAIAAYVRRTTEVVETLGALLADEAPDPVAIGEALDRAQSTLREDMGVSDDVTDGCIEALKRQGALGAKITGTGKGGCVFGVFPGSGAAVAVGALVAEGFAATLTEVSKAGVCPG